MPNMPIMSDFAQRLELGTAPADPPLQASQQETLRAFVERVQRDRQGAGGTARGPGAALFFCGSKGAGKKTTAAILARELGFALHRVDLDSVVGKYIGETEKNIEGLFAAAERAATVLLFDEADSLFGRRTDVKDSHDRYAGVASLLLAEIARHDVVTVFTSTNGPPDPTTAGRFQCVLEF
jgi:SpoVK/Ycf46/Vps4 family AAA+-type ATPase